MSCAERAAKRLAKAAAKEAKRASSLAALASCQAQLAVVAQIPLENQAEAAAALASITQAANAATGVLFGDGARST